MRKLVKTITHPFLKLGLNLFYCCPREYCFENICITVHPDVFPPQLTFSTKILLDYIKELTLENKTLLELGCGSGIIAMYAAKKGALVTASDVNKTALQYLKLNAEQNNAKLDIVESDLFNNIPKAKFDYIIINPPYYPKTPKNVKEKAWYCGSNFDYFEALFKQLHAGDKGEKIIMILSEDCDIKTIKTIANQNQMQLRKIKSIRNKIEINYIFKVEMITPPDSIYN